MRQRRREGERKRESERERERGREGGREGGGEGGGGREGEREGEIEIEIEIERGDERLVTNIYMSWVSGQKRLTPKSSRDAAGLSSGAGCIIGPNTYRITRSSRPGSLFLDFCRHSSSFKSGANRREIGVNQRPCIQ